MRLSVAILTLTSALASVTSAQQNNTDTYDYVIVGGGVGGTYLKQTNIIIIVQILIILYF